MAATHGVLPAACSQLIATIVIGTKDRTYGDIATALFAFKGQMPSLLEEELALLRGRDDFMQPGVETGRSKVGNAAAIYAGAWRRANPAA